MNRYQKQLIALCLTALLCALLLAGAIISTAQAPQPSFVVIQSTPSADGVHLVIGFEGLPDNPHIDISNGRLGTVSIAGESGRYHGTVAARLAYCNSRLTIATYQIDYTCQRFPFAAKE